MRHESRKIDSLLENNVWELVEQPKDRKPVGSKWVFKVKTNADGSFERCKARLVAQEYSQKGLDYDETFSLLVRSESVRSVIAWMNPGEYLSVILSNEDNQSAICIAQNPQYHSKT